MDEKDVKQIISDYLTANGFDGLYHPDPDMECDCFLIDLLPCASGFSMCRPGVKHMGEDGDWGIFQP